MAQLPFQAARPTRPAPRIPKVVVSAEANANFRNVVAVLDEARKVGIQGGHFGPRRNEADADSAFLSPWRRWPASCCLADCSSCPCTVTQGGVGGRVDREEARRR